MGEQQRRKQLRTGSATPDEGSRKLWVIAVLAFWISAGITLTVTLITGKLDFILVCITLGMMVLGVWLKTRYVLQQRRASSHTSGGDST